jgi:membrane glycosyltransferase
MKGRSFHPLSREVLVFRRGIFFLLTFLLAAGGSLLFYSGRVEPLTWMDPVLWGLFALLFFQISVGLVLSATGFFLAYGGGDRHDPLRQAAGDGAGREALPATAVLLPVYNEDVPRVIAGLRSMWESLGRTGCRDSFDFYLLSDSNQPEAMVREEEAWIGLTQELGAKDRIFYRKRRKSINKKSGNIADFCRRWGNHYRYMIVLDADSVMSGDLMVRLARAMEAFPKVGIIQTVPVMVFGDSLLRRVLQFTVQLCGPLFSLGSSYWQGSSANYWGHNAIIRVAAFMKHCALPALPVLDPAKRHILSHDTVEAALMRKAGYEVWLTAGEKGSYEESPPTLTDLLLRDRRWCKGNLQHAWFLAAKGINFANRLHIWFGLMAYLSSPLWLLFLALSAANAWTKERYVRVIEPDYQPFFLLFAITLAFLILPKLLGWLWTLPRARAFGGGVNMTVSLVLEILFSVLLAPILMIFHSFFVVEAILGVEEKWNLQNRNDQQLSWGHCVKAYGGVTVLGILSCLAARSLLPEYFWWFSPICFSWMCSIPLARWTSSVELGRRSREAGLFLIPEEREMPAELKQVREEQALLFHPERLEGLERVLLHPRANALHTALLRVWGRKNRQSPRQLQALWARILEEGPSAAKGAERYVLMWDLQGIQDFHDRIWRTPAAALPAEWKHCFSRLQRELGGSF